MRWSTVIGVGVAALMVAAAYLAVRATGPLLSKLRTAPLVTAAGKRGRAGLTWLTGRVATQVLVLIAGSAVVLALASVFVEILDAVTDSDDLTVIDRPVVEWLAAHRSSGLTRLELAFTDLGGVIVLTVALTVTMALVAVRLRTWQPIVFTVVAIGGIQLLVQTIKVLIARDRPNPAAQVVSADGFSFPSGHAASSLVGFAVIAWLICMTTQRRAIWATAWLAAALLTGAVGVSRMYLGVHYPSDVIGGWVLGATWLAAVAVAVRVWPGRAGSSPGEIQPAAR